MSSTREHVVDNIPFYKAYDKDEYYHHGYFYSLLMI